MSRTPRAFTLVELLVVVTIIALLAGLLLPAVSVVRNSARTLLCAGNLNQVYVAYTAYAQDWRGGLPRCWAQGYYSVWDIGCGQATYLNERPCSANPYHIPSVFVCPNAAASALRQNEAYACYQFPTYWHNTEAWVARSQLRMPQTGGGPTAIPASALVLLVECPPAYTNGFHWAWGPLLTPTRFFFSHRSQMNVLYFDGHVGSQGPSTLGTAMFAGDL